MKVYVVNAVTVTPSLAFCEVFTSSQDAVVYAAWLRKNYPGMKVFLEPKKIDMALKISSWSWRSSEEETEEATKW